MNKINLEIESFDPKKAELEKIIEPLKGLKIKDTKDIEGFDKVHQGQMELRRLRVEIEKKGLEVRRKIKVFSDNVMKEQKELTDIIEPIEKELKEEKDRIKELKEIEKRKEDLPKRKERLKEIELNADDDFLLKMNDKEFDNYFVEKKGEYLEEKQRKIREQEEKLRREKEIEEAKEQAKIEAEKEAKEKAENQRREQINNILESIGMKLNGYSFVYDDLDVDVEELYLMKKDDLVGKINELKKEIAKRKKEKVEKEKKEAVKQAEKEAKEKAEKERQKLIDEQKQKEAERIENERKAKEEEERKKREKAEKEAKEKEAKRFKKFLKDNGVDDPNSDEVQLLHLEKTIVLYKKVAVYKK